MSDSTSINEIYQNGIRLLKDKDFKMAIKNFEFVLEKSEANIFKVNYYLAQCYSELEDYKTAIQNLSVIIKSFNLGDKSIDPTLYVTAVFLYGQIDMATKFYSNAVTMFDTIISFSKKEEFDSEILEEAIKLKADAEDKYEKYGDKNKTRTPSRTKKQIPYTSEDPQKKNKTLRAKPYQRLKNIPPEKQKKEMTKLWQEMNERRMDIEEGSKWYIISTTWWNKWKLWTGFSEKVATTKDDSLSSGVEKGNTNGTSDVQEPGRIDNEDLIEVNEIGKKTNFGK